MAQGDIQEKGEAPSRGLLANSGNGASFRVLDIGHADYAAVIEPDTAFWTLVSKDEVADVFAENSELHHQFQELEGKFHEEMQTLRYGLKPSAVYFNPTERCNLNCTYCYIPESLRKSGEHMGAQQINDALQKLKEYFASYMPEGRWPQIVFHGAEPLMNKEAMFQAIDTFHQDFNFGVQTNGTLLDDEAAKFLMDRRVAVGLSLDAADPAIADEHRRTWDGSGVYNKVIEAMEKLEGYPLYNVICTVTESNMHHLRTLVKFFHDKQVPACLLNMVRCTLPEARKAKPDDTEVARYFLDAVEYSHSLYEETGRKLIIANFANILLSIVAPTARRLMCDISPCGGGRSFFAVAPDGGLFPCSEFIGLPDFKGGNLFQDDIEDVRTGSAAFTSVTERQVENISPCSDCAIRHFCGSPCPAEAYEMNGGMKATGAFCEFYERQVRYAFKLIAEGRENDFLWDGWDTDTETTFALT